MTNCPQCGSPIKTVPAGVSKTTGRSYNAFQACSNRQCTWKPPREQRSQPSHVPQQPAPQIGVAADMLRELQEIKAIMLLINSKMPPKQQSTATATPAGKCIEPNEDVDNIDDQLEACENVPF